MLVSVIRTFEASHVLPKHPGHCSRLHGHSWTLRVAVSGEINQQTGMVCDFTKLKEIVDKHIINVVDHQHLGYGDVWGVPKYDAVFGTDFYPTSENLVVAFAKMLSPLVSELGVRLGEIELNETCTSSALWRPE